MDAAAALGALAADKMVEIVRSGGSLRRLRERGAAPYLVCSTQRMIGGRSARAARGHSPERAARTTVGRVAFASSTWRRPCRRPDATLGPGFSIGSLKNMMRSPLALEALDHGHVFRVTIWEKRLYDLLPTTMRFAHVKIFASRYAAFFDVRFLYTAVSKSRYPVKETGSPKGRICVAQNPPRPFCRSIQ
jgi:hypothetical protein